MRAAYLIWAAVGFKVAACGSIGGRMLELRVREFGAIPVEAECLRPDGLRGLSLAEVERLPVLQGNRRRALGDLFACAGDAGDGAIRLLGDCSRVKRVGEGMRDGSILIDGSAGAHLGAGMRGGRIEVRGDAGDWAGAEMRGGEIRIRGGAGDHLGAAYPGSLRGMRGGVILVGGDAGHEVGSNLRRGVIAVAGGVGAFAGIAMIAGTILAGGGFGPRPGAGMKRGTLISLGACPELPPSFRVGCDYSPQFLALLERELAGRGVAFGLSAARFRRYSGDLLALGKGELLQRVA